MTKKCFVCHTTCFTFIYGGKAPRCVEGLNITFGSQTEHINKRQHAIRSKRGLSRDTNPCQSTFNQDSVYNFRINCKKLHSVYFRFRAIPPSSNRIAPCPSGSGMTWEMSQNFHPSVKIATHRLVQEGVREVTVSHYMGTHWNPK